ncbi:RHS repeat domain-containing protein [Pseudomonas sp. P2757]|uniref:RHS repeat domain-containing protein n=1 Tax=unclassified Pseudomonas TaxID=196821 RepID=UPI003B5AB754
MHFNTPKLTVVDPRGLPIRSVEYWRAIEGAPVEPRVERTCHDAAGRPVQRWDARLWALQAGDPATPPNQQTVYSLDAAALCTVSVDAGAQFSLYGLGGELRSGFDSRETVVEIQYDPSLRPVAVFEQGVGQPRGCVERFTYGAPGVGDQQRNQYGQLIDHYDTAGQMRFDAFALGGQCTENTRRFTSASSAPDWPQLPAERERLLEAPPGATTQWRYGALGDVLEQTDAKGNRQSFSQTVDGHLRESRLQPKGQPEKTVVSAIEYNAYGDVERETAGNGVQTRLSYRAADGRLISREDKHSGAVLQHLIYAYDRMGSVLSIEDKALPIRYFASQRIDPVSRFDYDSLYQLIHAFGWEAGSVSQGPQSIGRADPAAIGNYQQTFDYDAAGNLLKLTHVGPQSHGRKLQAARYSNRCLPWEGDVPPSEAQIAAAYDRRGNLLEIDKGRSLRWNLRNQLQSVSPVERASGLDDSELYVYDGSGQRVRKIRSLHTNARAVTAEVRYLPGGLELRSDTGTGERLQVVNIEGALNTIRVLVWDSPPPMGNHQYRYCCADHLGSVSLETADDGTIINRETFHPFGTSAWQDGELSYKFVRYSGKERDATGLYYYGFRYYIPSLQRWASTDPAGFVDGYNLYAMVNNNPVTFHDANGLQITGKYEIEVGIKNRLKFMAATLASRIGVFKEETGKFKDVSDFEVVEVGAYNDYLVGGDELKQELLHYKQRYKQLASEESVPRPAGEPSNFALGANISSYMLRSANDKYFDDTSIDPEQRHPDFLVERRFFVVMNKADKNRLPGQRQIYGMSELNTFTEKGKTEVDVVQVVVHPETQPGGKLTNQLSPKPAGAQLPLLRGVGTFLTVHSVNAISKGTQVKKIKTEAVNPRSARIAKKFDAKLVSNR